jgi:hypothetical protein
MPADSAPHHGRRMWKYLPETNRTDRLDHKRKEKRQCISLLYQSAIEQVKNVFEIRLFLFEKGALPPQLSSCLQPASEERRAAAG